MEYAGQDPAINRSRYLLGRPFLERSIKHYSNYHQILLVGEGDFSFSLALANAFGSAENMVPTSLDTREKVLQLYDSAHKTLPNLERLGATILHGVDATTMEKHHVIRKMRFHRIVYNFPHAGFYGKEKDEKVIKKHSYLLKMFLKNARTLLSENGEIHVTHKEHGPYKEWELEKQAEECGLLLKDSVPFEITDYPGYTNRRGAGSNAGGSFPLGKRQTYKFVQGPEFLYNSGSLATQVITPNISSEVSAENCKVDLWKPEPKRQMKIAGEMAKVQEINKSDEFARERNDTLRQNAQAWSVNIKTVKQLNETLNLKEDAIKKIETSLVGAILELESERQTRKAVETAKADLETSLNDSMVILNKERKKNRELKRQLYEALCQKEEACREQAIIAKELNEALRLVENTVEQRGKILWQQKSLSDRKKKIYFRTVLSSGLAFALYLFRKYRARVKEPPRMSWAATWMNY